MELGEADFSWEDVFSGARKAWEAALTPRLIKILWRAICIIPFTGRVDIRMRWKEQVAQSKLQRGIVKVIDLNSTLRVFNKVGASTALPDLKDQGRNKGGCICFGRPLTRA